MADTPTPRQNADYALAVSDMDDMRGLLAWWFEATPERVGNFLAIIEHHGWMLTPRPQNDGSVRDG